LALVLAGFARGTLTIIVGKRVVRQIIHRDRRLHFHKRGISISNEEHGELTGKESAGANEKRGNI
jgi:hypothetical protein